MDLNRLFAMLGRMLMNSAVKTGVDYAARQGKPEAEMTPEERHKAKSMRKMAQRAQKVARMGRRFMK